MRNILLAGIVFMAILSLEGIFAAQNETMIVEADIYAEVIPEDVISIEVPDYVFLGEVNESEESDKAKIYVNNTGTVNVTITPQLVNQGNKIFQNLYFQNRMRGNNSVIFKIGDYSLNIAKPSSIGGKRSEYFYMWLDLSSYNEDITYNLIGEQEELLFVALPQ